ncbi:MAG: TolC family protein [Ignavibacteriales bacterium]|nr:MAG: TolC family protein [Ignavibacteriales bacterium]
MYRSNRNLIFWIAILLLFNFKIYAQEKLSLTVEQAIEIGLQNSKTLHSSLMKVKSADARISEMNAMRLPSLKLSAGYRKLSSVEAFSIQGPTGPITIAPSILDNYSTTLTLSQPLFTGFRLLSNSNIAEYTAGSTNEEYNKDKVELVFNIKNAYWSLFKATQLKKVMDDNVLMVKAHLDDAKNLMKVGMMTQNDVLKLDVQLSDMMFKQIDAENAVKLSIVALNSVLSIPLTTNIEIISSANLTTANYSELNKLIGDAVEQRPEIKSADYRIKASEAGVTMARSSWYPQISLYGNYYYSRPNQRIFPSKDEFKDTWDAGVNLSLNVWDWLTTAHQTEQAQATLAQAVDGIGIIKDNITLEVTQNYLSINQAKRKIDISELTVKQATENMRMTADKFKNGLALSSDVIDAETSQSTAKINYTNSIVDYELAKARLDKSIGK